MIAPHHILDMLSTNRDLLRRRSSAALENLSMLHSSFDELGDEGCIISLALNDAIAAMVYRADYAGAIRISQRIIDRYPHSSYIYLIASHEMLLGRCLTFSMAYGEAWEHLMRAETLAFDVLPAGGGTVELRADVLHEMSMVTVQSGGDRDEAVRYIEKSLRILGHIGYERRRAVLFMAIGNVRFAQGRLDDAQNYYMRAETLLEDTDDYYNLSTVLCNLGVCHTWMGAYSIAESYLDRSLSLRVRTGNYGDIASSYYNLAALYERREESERAYRTMLISRDYAHVSQLRQLQLMIIRELASLAYVLADAALTALHQGQIAELERVGS